MATCWNCGKKIIGTPIRSWQTTSYGHRGYVGAPLRAGSHLFVGMSSGTRQSRVNLCALCDAELNPVIPPFSQRFSEWYGRLNRNDKIFLAVVGGIIFALFVAASA